MTPQRLWFQLGKQFLQHRSAMLRLGLTPECYLAYRLGCSVSQAERLIVQLREMDEEASPAAPVG